MSLPAIPNRLAVTGRIESWLNDPNSRLPVSCTVVAPEDSMEGTNGIENSWLFTSKALRNAAGVAVHLSKIRPRGIENGKGLVSSGPVSFAQIYSKLNEVLRRGGQYKNGAITLHLDYDHPDSLEFIQADRATLPWAKRALNVDEKFMDYPHMDAVIAAMKRGDLWLVKKTYGKDGERILHNVCVSGDTLIYTERGPVAAKELVDKPFLAAVNGAFYKSDGFWSNGVKPVVELKTVAGHSLRLTPDHKILTPSGWVEAGQLQPNDQVVLNRLTDIDDGTTTVVSVEPAGEEEVFDCTVDEVHCFDANGFIVHNCLEVNLPERGTCLLAHVNLGQCDKSNLVAAFTEGMKFLCELHPQTGVGESGIYLPPTEDKQVGLGVVGLANLLANEGITYADFVDALEYALNGTPTFEIPTASSEAKELANAFVEAYRWASKVAESYGMVRAFAIAPTASCSYRYKDINGYTTTPEIAPPISRQVDRDSATFGVESYDYPPNVEIAEEVGWDVFFRLNCCFQRLQNISGLGHAISTNWWSDMVVCDREFIQRWLESPLRSLYYSLQVMEGIQDKSQLLGDGEADLSILGLDGDFFPSVDQEMESIGDLNIPCVGCAE